MKRLITLYMIVFPFLAFGNTLPEIYEKANAAFESGDFLQAQELGIAALPEIESRMSNPDIVLLKQIRKFHDYFIYNRNCKYALNFSLLDSSVSSKNFGSADNEYAAALLRLGIIKRELSRFDEAQILFDKAILIYIDNDQMHRKNYHYCKIHKGELLRQQAKYIESEDLLKEAVDSAMAHFFRDKASGLGASIIIWLVFADIYDGFILLGSYYFSDYPLEVPIIIVSMLNPIDLGRISVMIQMDLAALMGYTGAVFEKFFTGGLGISLAFAAMLVWIAAPLFFSFKIFDKKNF